MDHNSSDGLDNTIDEMLSSDVVLRLAQAKAELERQMAALGLTSREGWKIQEELRDTETGTRWVFRPVHLRRDAPGLEACVVLDHAGHAK